MISVVVRRYMWVLTVVAILIGSWLVADTVNALIADRITAAVPGKAATRSTRSIPTGVAANERTSFETYKTAIRGRNIFDSLNRAPDEEDVPIGTGVLEPVGEAEGCTLPITVISTLPVVNEASRSMATLQDRSDSPAVTIVVAVGEEIADGRLAWVDRDGVEIVRSEGRRERCEIDKPQAVASVSRIGGKRKVTGKPSGKGIQRVSANKFVISSDEIQSALNNLSALATEARIVPYFENGESKGFKLYSIKPSSLIAKVGIMNGDVIQKVNGYEINSPEKALQIYSMLKTETKISIDIVRNGRPKTYNYEIK